MLVAATGLPDNCLEHGVEAPKATPRWHPLCKSLWKPHIIGKLISVVFSALNCGISH
jgi:hypothetical protein